MNKQITSSNLYKYVVLKQKGKQMTPVQLMSRLGMLSLGFTAFVGLVAGLMQAAH